MLGTSIDDIADLDVDSLVGKRWTDKGYTSTTMDRAIAKEFRDPSANPKATNQLSYEIEIRSPKGTRATYMDNDTVKVGAFDEAELLLDRNTSFQIARSEVVETTLANGKVQRHLKLVVDVKQAAIRPPVNKVTNKWLDDMGVGKEKTRTDVWRMKNKVEEIDATDAFLSKQKGMTIEEIYTHVDKAQADFESAGKLIESTLGGPVKFVPPPPAFAIKKIEKALPKLSNKYGGRVNRHIPWRILCADGKERR